MGSALQEFVKGVIDRKFAGNQQQLAEAIGVTGPTVSKIVRGVGGATFAAVNCLKLAEVSGEAPSRVLELAGKGDVAKLIERLYGKARAPMTPDDVALLSLPPDRKHQLVGALGLEHPGRERKSAGGKRASSA